MLRASYTVYEYSVRGCVGSDSHAAFGSTGATNVILVCGEALMDVVGGADGCRRLFPGGGPFNTARALTSLGVAAAFLGHLSRDAYGSRLAEELRTAGVSLEFASCGSEPTTAALATVDAHGVAHYEFQTEGTSAPNLTGEMLPERLGPEVEALHVGTLGLVLEPMATTLVELVRREQGHRLVMVDPNIRPQLLADSTRYRGRLEHQLFPASTIVKASEQDLAWLYPDLDVEAACEHVLALGPRLVIATLGSKGAFGLTPRGRAYVDVSPVDVVDTIGAGDVFGAGLLAWLHDRHLPRTDLDLATSELEAALTFACRAAAWSCTRAGAASPTRQDVVELGHRHDTPRTV